MPIQILPARLANQIAAGEVVERPASVIKELVENALDAGATRIDIEVEKGGSKLIRIRDNGCGIAKDELTLALSRHATSKVSSFDDLENITSLGFRGEALASISSVARLKLTSKPAQQSEAWQAYAEGRDMAVKVIPAAHPQGTTIEVVDLFFNTPARRKFLRSDKTEFYHIDELIKRIALSRFDVQLNLIHNGKRIRQLRSANSEAEQSRRVAAICGKGFIETALQVSCEYDGINLFGWIASPAGCSSQNETQFSYVNGRMMRDKLINHAIRQAYGEHIGQGYYPGYVLYLTVDPRQIDVNVHPAKHEVRFHQARLVHDFIVQVLEQSLAQPEVWSKEEVGSEVLHEPSFDPVDKPIQSDSGYMGGGIKTQGQSRAPQGSYQHGNKPSATELKHYHQAMTLFTAPSEVQESKPESIDLDNNSSSAPLPKQHSSLAEINTSEQTEKPYMGKGVCLSVINGQFALYQQDNVLFLLDLNKVNGKVAAIQFSQGLLGQPLLLPVKLPMEVPEDRITLKWLEDNGGFLASLGMEIECLNNAVIVRKVPALLRQQNISERLTQLFSTLATEEGDKWSLSQCLFWLYSQFGQKPEFDLCQATKLIHTAVRFEAEAQVLADCGMEIPVSTYIGLLARSSSDKAGLTSDCQETSAVR